MTIKIRHVASSVMYLLHHPVQMHHIRSTCLSENTVIFNSMSQTQRQGLVALQFNTAIFCPFFHYSARMIRAELTRELNTYHPTISPLRQLNHTVTPLSAIFLKTHINIVQVSTGVHPLTFPNPFQFCSLSTLIQLIFSQLFPVPFLPPLTLSVLSHTFMISSTFLT